MKLMQHLDSIPTPCYVADEDLLAENLALLQRVQTEANCKIILALKGFSMVSTFPQLRQVLKGTTASSLHEAMLGRYEFGGEVHSYCTAYDPREFEQYLEISDHLSFNSFSQWQRFKPLVDQAIQQKGKKISCGIRINPEHSESDTEIYDPCCKFSRLGVTLREFKEDQLQGIEGFHFHNHCQNDADALERTLTAVVDKFGKYFDKIKWINFGGGHYITNPGYQVDKLIDLIKRFQERFPLKVYLEPGGAVCLNAGVLVTSVLDLVRNEMDIAMLDASATAHTPDVLEMPYRAEIVGAAHAGHLPYSYQLAGTTCLASDVFGEYSFSEPLRIGSKLVFTDMLQYTMVKNNTFNGVRLPSMGLWSNAKGFRLVKSFGYEDYKSRL